ncbi:MAG: sigma-70 family RNA polymerase sigma factor [Clostridiales bacterium]|nr:sigma-70 family RNA polymerase sigma factor [Clostridiales bacterium]
MDSTKEINEYLKRLKNGERCLEEFFYAVSGYINLIAYKYLVDKSFVHDVVSSTFYKIFDNIQSFDELQNGKAWISKIAQNEAYTINTRERKHSYVPLDEVSEEIACTTDDTKKLEFAAAFQKALSKLDEKDREIVELRIYEDMTFEEIANRLNMYVGTVHKRFKRSVKKINEDIL